MITLDDFTDAIQYRLEIADKGGEDAGINLVWTESIILLVYRFAHTKKLGDISPESHERFMKAEQAWTEAVRKVKV